MVKQPVASPFGSESVADVPLPRAPLALTLTQVRFPQLAALTVGDVTANEVISTLGADFPILDVATETMLTFGPAGQIPLPTQAQTRVWNLKSADERWHVSFGPQFMSFYTSVYSSREDFVARFANVWRSFRALAGVPSVQRVGYRYVNRVTERAFLERLPDMVRPEILGASLAGGEAVPVARSIAEHEYGRPDQDRLLTRWGILPPGVTVDAALPVVPSVSWVFDIDSYRTPEAGLPAPEQLPDTVAALGQAGYRFFRWAVTDQFLSFFGGDV